MKIEIVVLTNIELLQAWEVIEYMKKKFHSRTQDYYECLMTQRHIEEEMAARDFLKDQDLMNSVRKKFVDELP